jgi:hypothetical protein
MALGEKHSMKSANRAREEDLRCSFDKKRSEGRVQVRYVSGKGDSETMSLR